MLYLSADFCYACKMFGIQPQAALHFYINQMTVYSSLSETDNHTLALALKVFEQCQEANRYSCVQMDEGKQLTSIGYVKEVVRIITSKQDLTEKEARYRCVINHWYAAIALDLLPEIITVSDGFTITLTKDFCILCELFQCEPVTVLQHYVDHVSLPKYIHSGDENAFVYATAFFLQLPAIINQVNFN